MIAGIVGEHGLPDEIAQETGERTDGVPLFIEEMTKAVVESGPRATETLASLPHPALAVPATLHASLIARLDRLGPAARDVAQKSAVIGREFRYGLIAAIADRPEPELRDALERLTSAGLLLARGAPPEATFLFKHALVQDTAYGMLLKSRRQDLHGMLAEVLEQGFPEIAETQPELLAHHYTEGKQIEKAISLWQKAGSLALKRMALPEAITHLNKGMELVVSLPASAERDSEELGLRTLLGTPWTAHKGWQVPEVWDSLCPALALAHSLHRNDMLVPILWGLAANVLTTGRVAEVLSWVAQMLEAADAYRDTALRIVGHTVAVCSHFYLGDLIKVRIHADQALKLFSEERHSHLAAILSQEPKTFILTWMVLSTWMLGYPERAVALNEMREAQARRRRLPFTLGWALTYGASLFDLLGEPDELLKRVEEGRRVGRENSLLVVTDILAPWQSGVSLIRKGQFTAGVSSLDAGLALWEEGGGGLATPYLKSVLAEGVAQVGNLDGALGLIEEVIRQVERRGWEERAHYAETLRIKGWLLSLKGDLDGAERNYIASLDWARRQQAKSWELRTATSYARLMRDQGRLREALDLLAPIYGWFTEGFGTKDLIEAKRLLDELQGAIG